MAEPNVGPDPNSQWAQEALRKAAADRAAAEAAKRPQHVPNPDPELNALELQYGVDFFRQPDGSITYLALDDAGFPAGMKPFTDAPKSAGTGNALGFGQLEQSKAEFEYGKGRDAVKDAQWQQQVAAEAAAAEKNLALQERKLVFDQLESSQALMMQQAALLENAQMSRVQMKEQARQFGIQQTMQSWQTAMSAVVQLGQLSLQESERTQKILADGTDFVYRAWESRGEKSPLARVTQADQINAVKTSLNQVRDFLTNIPPVFIPEIDLPDMPQFGASAPAEGGAAAPAGGTPTAPAVPNSGGAGSPYAQTAVYDENGNVSGWGTVGSPGTTPPATAPAGSGFGTYTPAPTQAPAAAAAAPTPTPNLTPPTFNVNAPGNGDVNAPGANPWAVPSPPTTAAAAAQPAGSVSPMRDPWAVPSAPGSNFGAFLNDPFNRSGATPTLWDVLNDPFRRSGTTGRTGPDLIPQQAGFGSRAPYGTTPIDSSGRPITTRAAGGSVPAGEPAVVGEDGYEVMWTNPDGTAEVLPHAQAKQVVAKNGKMKGYEDGTSAGGRRRSAMFGRMTAAERKDFMDQMVLPTRALGSPNNWMGRARDKLHGYSDGTWGATAAIAAYNAGSPSALSSYNSGNTGGSFGSYGGGGGGGGATYPVAPVKPTYPTVAQPKDTIPAFQGPDFGAMLRSMYPASPTLTQEQLLAEAESKLPPAPRDVLAGRMPAPLRLPFEAPTARQQSTLTQDERDALGNYTGLKYNIPATHLAEQTARLFGIPAGAARRALMGGVGI